MGIEKYSLKLSQPNVASFQLPGPIHLIQTAVAEAFGITRDEMLAQNRMQQVAHARILAIALASELTKASPATLGRKFQRHHTSILSAIRRAPGLVENYPEYAEKRAAVLARLNVA